MRIAEKSVKMGIVRMEFLFIEFRLIKQLLLDWKKKKGNSWWWNK